MIVSLFIPYVSYYCVNPKYQVTNLQQSCKQSVKKFDDTPMFGNIFLRVPS